MFYSHEVLTSRKHGVATIWLVATLGQKSSLKRVTRKQILDVDVSKACQTIITPDAPFALRLQSNLLYGVSRVYDQQCGYVLSDAQHAQNCIRAMLRVVHQAELDPEAKKAKTDQLILQDDPAFIPNLDISTLQLELPDFRLEPHDDTQLSNFSLTASPGSVKRSAASGGIAHTPGSSASVGFGSGPVSVASQAARGHSELLVPEEELLPDIGFEIDDQGNVVEVNYTSPELEIDAERSTLSRASKLKAQEGRAAIQQRGLTSMPSEPMDIDAPLITEVEQVDHQSSVAPAVLPSSSSAFLSQEDPSSVASAPMRKRRRPRNIIFMDANIELRNRDLLALNATYAERMKVAATATLTHKAPSLAKKNADFWVLGSGLNGVGRGIGESKAKSPLDMFAGGSLYKLVTGSEFVSNISLSNLKRNRDSGQDENEDTDRRIRPRRDDGEEHAARGLYPDDAMDPPLPMDSTEVPREAEGGLEDISSTMPWNITGSARGSSITISRILSAGPASQIPSSFLRRGRLTSASPLTARGRGTVVGSISEGFLGLSSEMHAEDFGGAMSSGLPPISGEYDDFQLQLDTQTSTQQRAALDRESFNFLSFLEQNINDKRAAAIDTVDANQVERQHIIDSVEFEEILPPSTTPKAVAAHALLHVLSLNTKNLITTTQKEPYGAICIKTIEVTG